ncbi:MAG: hypothetical protein HY721_28565 [Planctomycetes bacterium]|nr:hypothetical protein [Planctomycetota bacterium]
MRNCYHCGAEWEGFRGQPRTREVCEGCGRYLRCCANCHHFDARFRSACTLKHTTFVGNREVLNYCEEFKILDTEARKREDKVLTARETWERLFRR